jgi:hypothetical protein
MFWSIFKKGYTLVYTLMGNWATIGLHLILQRSNACICSFYNRLHLILQFQGKNGNFMCKSCCKAVVASVKKDKFK